VIWPFAQLIDALRVLRAERLFPAPPIVPAVLASPDALATAALAVAVSQIGLGEAGGNNVGPDVARYIAPAKPPASWCAGFFGWCYEQAAVEIGMPLPFRRSLGAKALGRNVGAVGRVFQDSALARPGDAMVFHRGAQGSWMGHIAMIEKVVSVGVAGSIVDTVEGNSGPKVMRRTRHTTDPADRFAFFASIRR
jgi:hypothetical protein